MNLKEYGGNQGDYLFFSGGEICFVVIETEMEQLNDYCFCILNAVDSKYKQLKNQIKDLDAKSPHEVLFTAKMGDLEWEYTASEMSQAINDIDVPKWEDNLNFVSYANCILLLYIFVEKSLKDLTKYMKGEDEKPAKQIKGYSKVVSYIKYMNDTLGLNFTVDENILNYIDEARIVRNAYAHGDWDEIRKLLSNKDLREYFTAASSLFYLIENAWDNRKTN